MAFPVSASFTLPASLPTAAQCGPSGIASCRRPEACLRRCCLHVGDVRQIFQLTVRSTPPVQPNGGTAQSSSRRPRRSIHMDGRVCDLRIGALYISDLLLRGADSFTRHSPRSVPEKQIAERWTHLPFLWGANRARRQPARRSGGRNVQGVRHHHHAQGRRGLDEAGSARKGTAGDRPARRTRLAARA